MKEISKGDKVLWIDEKGLGPAEEAEVVRILLDNKIPFAYEVQRSEERPAAVFRALDVLALEDAPPGLIPLLNRLGAFKTAPLNGAIEPNTLLKMGVGNPSGLERLESLSEEIGASGQPPLILEISLPPAMASMESQKIIGVKFLAQDRSEIGLVSRITTEGKAQVLVSPRDAERVKKMIESGSLPEASIQHSLSK